MINNEHFAFLCKENAVKERNIDFSSCSSLDELHQILREKLELPSFYGENLDALWDSITGLMYVPAMIKIKKGGTKELEQYIDKVIAIFFEAQAEYDEIRVMVVQE